MYSCSEVREFFIPSQVVQRDAEVNAEDEQVFLMKQQSQLAKQPAPGTSPAVSFMLLSLVRRRNGHVNKRKGASVD